MGLEPARLFDGETKIVIDFPLCLCYNKSKKGKGDTHVTTDEQGNEYLYATTVPVLLDGKRLAGKVAMEIYVRHGRISHWFGRRQSLILAAYTNHHPLPGAFDRLSDDLILTMLQDFSSENQGILVLYPCSPGAEAFVERNRSLLDNHFVILPPCVGLDPLAPLVKKV